MRLVDGDVSCVVEGDLRQGQQHWMYVTARVGGADNSLFYIKELRFKVLSGSERSRLALPVFFFIITKCVKVLCGYSIQKGLNAILSCYFRLKTSIHASPNTLGLQIGCNCSLFRLVFCIYDYGMHALLYILKATAHSQQACYYMNRSLIPFYVAHRATSISRVT